MSNAKKYQMKEGWTADKVAEAACDELFRHETLGARPGFAIIEFDAEKGDSHTDKAYMFTGFYHDENGVKCTYCASPGGTKTFSPSTRTIFEDCLNSGATVIVDEMWWGGYSHVDFFIMVGWDYVNMIEDGLAGLDPQLNKA